MAVVHNVAIISGQAVSGTNTYSGSLNVGLANNVSVQTVWTGTPTGTVTINASNDGVNWSSIGTASASGSASSNMQNFSNIGWVYVQVSYTNASGSGTLTATVATK